MKNVAVLLTFTALVALGQDTSPQIAALPSIDESIMQEFRQQEIARLAELRSLLRMEQAANEETKRNLAAATQITKDQSQLIARQAILIEQHQKQLDEAKASMESSALTIKNEMQLMSFKVAAGVVTMIVLSTIMIFMTFILEWKRDLEKQPWIETPIDRWQHFLQFCKNAVKFRRKTVDSSRPRTSELLGWMDVAPAHAAAPASAAPAHSRLRRSETARASAPVVAPVAAAVVTEAATAAATAIAEEVSPLELPTASAGPMPEPEPEPEPVIASAALEPASTATTEIEPIASAPAVSSPARTKIGFTTASLPSMLATPPSKGTSAASRLPGSKRGPWSGKADRNNSAPPVMDPQLAGQGRS